MHRAALVLVALVATVAGGLMAAPAPLPRPGRTGPWYDGWDRPVDPVGDCRFERTGSRLSITVPGRRKWAEGPSLLRDVEGDFAVQVRVGGDFKTWQAAGILLKDGKRAVRAWRLLLPGAGGLRDHCHFQGPWDWHNWQTAAGPSQGKATYLRLERQRQRLTAGYSMDARKWHPLQSLDKQALSRKLKIGVECVVTNGPYKAWVGVKYVETPDAPCKAVFDEFKLTPLGRQAQ
jgi:regulation of enolase protein 1 (concanavalin A-like superfamily)